MNKKPSTDKSTRALFATSASQAIEDDSAAASERAKKERRSVRKLPGDEGDGDDDPPPKRLHLDRRVEAVIAATGEGSDDDLLTTVQVAGWLGVSPQWVELARSKTYGPPFVRIAPQVIRYKRSAVVEWLREREYKRTSDYVAPTACRKRKAASPVSAQGQAVTRDRSDRA